MASFILAFKISLSARTTSVRETQEGRIITPRQIDDLYQEIASLDVAPLGILQILGWAGVPIAFVNLVLLQLSVGFLGKPACPYFAGSA